jgi:hypothetical protein
MFRDLAMAATLGLLTVAGCSSGPAPSAPAPTAETAPTMTNDASPADAPPADAKTAEFLPADEYIIDGQAVDRRHFEELRRALDIEAEPDMTGELEREDGAYGGYEATYKATHRTSGAAYRFTEIVYVEASGSHSRHELRKASP